MHLRIEYLFLGGCTDKGSTDSCLLFDSKDHKWKQVARMNRRRDRAACVLLQGNVIVAGGCCDGNNKLRSVESYNVADDGWSPMPDMIEGKINFSLVVVNNVVFAISSGSMKMLKIEMLDNTCNKFVYLRSPALNIGCFKAVALGNRFVRFDENSPLIVSYDVNTAQWIYEFSNVANYLQHYACVKVPWF